MRGWNALALWSVIAVSVVGCNGGTLDGSELGDAGGTGGSSGTGGNAGDDGGPPIACTRTEDCDDGLHCNGQETCVNRICAAGVAPSCDDNIACTVDRCVEDRHACESNAPDNDGDGHADAACTDDVGDALGDDCDDNDSTRYPGALEVCDADNHDEDCDLSTFGRNDLDGDGYLNANCCNRQDDNSLACGDDCDDFNARSHPFNTESCDGLDNDCNGLLDHPTEDQDGDGHATAACGGTDCDDLNPMTYAGAMELCDGFDNDCIQGGGIAQDEIDQDSDAFVVGVCMPMDETGLDSGDCDDDRPSASPMELELCNGRDDDCDQAVDEDLDCSSAVKQVAASYLQTCAVRVNGTVACWGRNDNGWLGTGSASWNLDSPRDVLDRRHPSGKLSDVRSVSLGRTHTCAVHLDGRVSCWGNAGLGALGVGPADFGTLPPSAVVGIEDAVQVCAGWNLGCARRPNGTVSCWGQNGSGQLGDETLEESWVPVQVLGIDSAIDLACGDHYACVVAANGNVWCWGDNTHGQIGDVTEIDRFTPTQVIGVEHARRVVGARGHACALLRDETIKCWGDNTYGQRGNGITEGGTNASLLLDFTGEPVTEVVGIAVGGGDLVGNDAAQRAGAITCAQVRDGRVLCVGENRDTRALGYGTWTNASYWAPERGLSTRYDVDGLSDVMQIAVGHNFGCGLRPDGNVECWGSDSDGQRAGWVYQSANLVEGL